MAFAMIVEFKAAPGCADELRRELLALVAPTRLEAGCTRYDLHVAEDEADLFVFYEPWASRDAHKAHDQSPHVNHFRTVKARLCAGEIRKLMLLHVEP
jgi:quinol monooxygenase YgiN